MQKLAVAIVHYHLQPGGVTRVIERAVESLNDEVDLLILSGEAPAPEAPLTPLCEPFGELEYSEQPNSDAQTLVDDLRFTARCLLGRDPDVWHIHNHSLGKNSFVPQAVKQLAESGCRLLLQPHDFAEDGRPDNYQLLRNHLSNLIEQTLYPTGDHIWYAPINSRDATFLNTIGVPNVHTLPNSVTATAQTSKKQPASNSKTILYPARAIRRKNLGEFILWSLLAPDGYRFQSTLAPQNPVWQAYYNDWVIFAKELNLPVDFDVGRTHDFAKLIQNAEAIMTTSIAEGFGLAFLEPWLEGKQLIGRNIPDITSDFADEGIDLSGLYDSLPVPIGWIGETEFTAALKSAMQTSHAAYARDWNESYFEEAKAALIVDGKVDFGVLNESLQQNVIRHLANNPNDREQLPVFDPTPVTSLINHNRQGVIDNYSQEAYGERLLNTYRKLAATEPGDVAYASANDLLDQFLKPERFNLLRT